MNQNPNRRGTPQNGQGQRHSGAQQNRPPLTPQQRAARRAYLERRRREIRRNRIILGVMCVIVVLLFIFLVSVIVRGIGAALGGAETAAAPDTDKTVPAVNDTVSDGTDSDLAADPGTVGTDAQTPVVTEEQQTDTPPAAAVDLSYEAMGFISNLTDFEAYMNPKEDRDAYLILVNADNPLSASDTPTDLVEVTNTRTDRAKQLMRKVPEKALQALYIEAHAAGMMSPDTPSGYPLSVTSAYRSYDTQNYLFQNYTQKELASHPGWTKDQAEAKVETYSCRPGTSEHQTGLCCDMHILSGADVSFADYEQAKWLEENCWKFGYILRFPKDKVDKTGISYEPWHFRYVGRYHAYQIHEQGLCLEEYIASLGN